MRWFLYTSAVLIPGLVAMESVAADHHHALAGSILGGICIAVVSFVEPRR